MDLHSTVQNDINLITVKAGRIDASVAIQFKDAMRAATSDPCPRVILDLSAVDFVDSSGLGAIVAAMTQVGSDSKLELAGLTPDVDKVFRLTRMDSVFTIHDSVDQIGDLRKTG